MLPVLSLASPLRHGFTHVVPPRRLSLTAANSRPKQVQKSEMVLEAKALHESSDNLPMRCRNLPAQRAQSADEQSPDLQPWYPAGIIRYSSDQIRYGQKVNVNVLRLYRRPHAVLR